MFLEHFTDVQVRPSHPLPCLLGCHQLLVPRCPQLCLLHADTDWADTEGRERHAAASFVINHCHIAETVLISASYLGEDFPQSRQVRKAAFKKNHSYFTSCRRNVDITMKSSKNTKGSRYG